MNSTLESSMSGKENFVLGIVSKERIITMKAKIQERLVDLFLFILQMIQYIQKLVRTNHYE